MRTYRKEPIRRRDTAHRLLFYISQRTSAKYPRWRDVTIQFLWSLYELRDRNPALSLVVHKEDGLLLYHNLQPIAYFHVRQRHMLVHAARGYLLWSKKHRPFATCHEGCWPVQWKCDSKEELDEFLRLVRRLPIQEPTVQYEGRSRHIPQWVREAVLERDEGRCQARGCGTTSNLHFDHILPYSRGGDSVEPKNVQILCRRHNLQKGTSQRS